MDKVEDVDFHIFQTPVSIFVEMPRHFSFLHVMHHLIEMALESLFQTVLGVTHILFLASSAGDQVVAVACHVVFSAIFSTCDQEE